MQSDSRVLETVDGINFELSQYFAPETIKGTLSVTLHAFVESPAENVLDDESFLMNDRGVSIGVVASKSVLLNDDHLAIKDCRLLNVVAIFLYEIVQCNFQSIENLQTPVVYDIIPLQNTAY